MEIDPLLAVGGAALFAAGLVLGHQLTMRRMKGLAMQALHRQFMDMAHVQNIVINSCRLLAGTAYLSTPQYLAAVKQVAKEHYNFDVQFHQPGDPR